ncbi:Hypothetical protein CINCED_3A022618 [Cinara cedri]|uniref:Uncharacterized protein n=1 Tax=Cinara cedri TaxID=506608 RepID=A0A5E4LZV1_9HEMI|nr:Hypothetical protein CINCED_3A022618 [Cinara cedri]
MYNNYYNSSGRVRDDLKLLEIRDGEQLAKDRKARATEMRSESGNWLKRPGISQ